MLHINFYRVCFAYFDFPCIFFEKGLKLITFLLTLITELSVPSYVLIDSLDIIYV